MRDVERREPDVLAHVRRHRRPVVGERDLRLGRAERRQVVTPEPAAELQVTVALGVVSRQPANGTATVRVALTFSWSTVCTLLVISSHLGPPAGAEGARSQHADDAARRNSPVVYHGAAADPLRFWAVMRRMSHISLRLNVIA